MLLGLYRCISKRGAGKRGGFVAFKDNVLQAGAFVKRVAVYGVDCLPSLNYFCGICPD